MSFHNKLCKYNQKLLNIKMQLGGMEEEYAGNKSLIVNVQSRTNVPVTPCDIFKTHYGNDKLATSLVLEMLNGNKGNIFRLLSCGINILTTFSYGQTVLSTYLHVLLLNLSGIPNHLNEVFEHKYIINQIRDRIVYQGNDDDEYKNPTKFDGLITEGQMRLIVVLLNDIKTKYNDELRNRLINLPLETFTILELAVQLRSRSLIEILKKFGADPRIKNSEGNTAVVVATTFSSDPKLSETERESYQKLIPLLV